MQVSESEINKASAWSNLKNGRNKQQTLFYLKNITETASGKHGHAGFIAVLPKIKIESQFS